MKPTPTERAALDKARTLEALPLEEASELSHRPDILDFDHRHDRLRLAQTRLVWAAEEWRRRELRLDLYRYALRKGDRTEIHYHRVTALDTPTKRIREDPRLKDLHVILHSSLSGVFNESMIKKVGANHFQAKYIPDELAAMVQDQLREYDAEHGR